MGIVRFALKFPYTFYVLAAFIVFGPLERSPSELNRGRDSRIGFDLLEDSRRGKGAAGDGAF